MPSQTTKLMTCDSRLTHHMPTIRYMSQIYKTTFSQAQAHDNNGKEQHLEVHTAIFY